MAKNTLTTNEAAIILEVSPSVIRRIIKDGELEAVKVGNFYEISAESVEKYCDNQRENMVNDINDMVGYTEKYPWTYYLGKGYKQLKIDRDKVGKWQFYYKDMSGGVFADKMCKKAIEDGVLKEAKYFMSFDGETGVACFYTTDDDIEENKRIINYFMENELIRKTKTGRLYNIAFKYDNDTLNGDYGKDFKAKITLSDYVDLDTGQFKR